MDLFVPERLLENKPRLLAYIHGYFKAKQESKRGRTPKELEDFISVKFMYELLDPVEDTHERYMIRNAADWGAAVAREEDGDTWRRKYVCDKCEEPRDMVEYVENLVRGAIPK